MYTIGEFSNITHITKKALRWYDDTGVLPAAFTDPDTGYRYYEPSQVDTARLLSRLKTYGFSLDQIRRLLQDPDPDWKQALEKRRLDLQAQQEQTRLILQDLSCHIASYERTKDIMQYQKQYSVTLTDRPALPVIACRQTTGVDQIGSLFSRVFETIGQQNIPFGGETGIRYFDQEFDPEHADMEAFAVVPESFAQSLIPGCQAAFVTHRGAYSNLGDAYAALNEWIRENGYEIVQPPYEIYRVDGHAGVPVEDWKTDIYFPVRPKQA